MLYENNVFRVGFFLGKVEEVFDKVYNVGVGVYVVLFFC